MFFEQKKVKIETLGEYLREARGSLNFTQEEISQKTDISSFFLKQLESGVFTNLPADVYVLGFLKKLSKLYGVESDLLINQYKKEKCIQGQISKLESCPTISFKKIFAKIVITPKLIAFSFAAIFVLGTLFYIFWQVFSINRMPNLQIFQPQDKQAIKSSSVLIKGKTDPGMSVEVNGHGVFVDNEGRFETQVGVSFGPKDIEITAKNKFDKSISKKISIVGEVQNKASNKVELKIDASQDIIIEYIIDNNEKKQETIQKNESKILQAEKSVVISTNNGGATSVVVNGQNIGVLGRMGERLENISFSPESGTINK